MQQNLINIYGDNVLECEEALSLVAKSFEAKIIPLNETIVAPSYLLEREGEQLYRVQLFPGYDRWQYDVKKFMVSLGARLKESTDAVITMQDTKSGEVPILAFEFSGALPAGNNAWQRCGRALACAQAKIPYLYFGELGGVELDGKRGIKAARFPNPMVPFSYLTLGKRYNSGTLPVYRPSPSINPVLSKSFGQFFAGEEVYKYIKSVILGKVDFEAQRLLEEKALSLVKYLASKRKKSVNIFSENDWNEALYSNGGNELSALIAKANIAWKKKISIPLTKTFRMLLNDIVALKPFAVGSAELPFCMVTKEKRIDLAGIFRKVYADKLSEGFYDWLESSSVPLFLTFVAGFKPRGDDSRPDRGLVPLLRMVTGDTNVDILTLVYGPGKASMFEKLKNDMWSLANENGLWQAILNTSDGVIVDSLTATNNLPVTRYSIGTNPNLGKYAVTGLKSITTPIRFGEHDVDTVIHSLFTTNRKAICFEGLCNPPGGNWSGISTFDFSGQIEHRWVSLPRVSGGDAKRPDHVFQVMGNGQNDRLIIIESKDTSISVEDNIGARLKNYLTTLLFSAPTIFRKATDLNWGLFDDGTYSRKDYELVSVAAFRYVTERDLQVISRSNVDAVLGIEFQVSGDVNIHILDKTVDQYLATLMNELVSDWEGHVKVTIH